MFQNRPDLTFAKVRLTFPKDRYVAYKKMKFDDLKNGKFPMIGQNRESRSGRELPRKLRLRKPRWEAGENTEKAIGPA